MRWSFIETLRVSSGCFARCYSLFLFSLQGYNHPNKYIASQGMWTSLMVAIYYLHEVCQCAITQSTALYSILSACTMSIGIIGLTTVLEMNEMHHAWENSLTLLARSRTKLHAIHLVYSRVTLTLLKHLLLSTLWILLFLSSQAFSPLCFVITLIDLL